MQDALDEERARLDIVELAINESDTKADVGGAGGRQGGVACGRGLSTPVAEQVVDNGGDADSRGRP